MIKLTAFIAILALRIIYQPSNAQSVNAPFASPSPAPVATVSTTPAKLVCVAGSISNQKVVLNWMVNENESADQFEIEKSIDGKKFSTVALVFGTDTPDTGNYQFYEKAGNQKVLYRIKLINKNRQTEYSAVVEINPNA